MNQASGQIHPPTAGTARLDLCAAGLSTLCLIHCLALPMLVSLLPLAAQSVESHLLHRILAAMAVPVSLRVVWKALPVGGNGLFIGAALTGLGLLLLGAFVEAVSAYEEPITVAGGVLLGSAHLWHWMRQRGRGPIDNQPAGGDRPQSDPQRNREGQPVG